MHSLVFDRRLPTKPEFPDPTDPPDPMDSDSPDSVTDSLSHTEWTNVLSRFEDRNLYQTWEYARHRYGEDQISAVVVGEVDDPVAAALVRLVRLPLTRRGIAYVRWGPLWRRAGVESSLHSFVRGLRALREEYVRRRSLVLRLRPYLFENEPTAGAEDLLRSEDCHPVLWRGRERTLLVDLGKPLEEIRKGLAQKWRNHLNGAERNELEIVEGTGDHLLERFGVIYQDLVERKQFSEVRSVEEFRRIQRDLPEPFKIRVFLCESRGSLCGGIVCSMIGSTGFTLLRATNRLGLRLKAAHLVQWRALQWMKDAGCTHYDLSGINPEENPGTYKYKAGLCGKNGRDLLFLPQYDVYPDGISRTMLPILERGYLAFKRARDRYK